MSVNFNNSTFTGTASNFVGLQSNLSTGATTASATSGSFSYSGTLNFAAGAFVMDGTVTGSIDLGNASGAISNGELFGNLHNTSRGITSSGGISGDIDAGGTQTGLIGNYIISQ